MFSTVIIIPVRLPSKRLPGKPMMRAGGLPLIHWVYLLAKQVVGAEVLVATPDVTISNYCDRNGIPWEPTDESTPTGTHRCAEVLAHSERCRDADVVVNWQGDTLAGPADVKRMIFRAKDGPLKIWTLVGPLSGKERDDPNVVKVDVYDGRAWWFARTNDPFAEHHIGVYTYSAKMLKELGELKPTVLSEAKSLEQLAWLQAGYTIKVERVLTTPLSINTRADWDKFKKTKEG